MYVFVFGTLKDGFPNHSENEGKKIVGRFMTRDKYPLYLIGERFYLGW
jgi:gamma-glutamylaminecyclotransferase